MTYVRLAWRIAFIAMSLGRLFCRHFGAVIDARDSDPPPVISVYALSLLRRENHILRTGSGYHDHRSGNFDAKTRVGDEHCNFIT